MLFQRCLTNVFYEITCILISIVNCKNLKVYYKKVVTSLRAGQASAAKTAHYSVLPIWTKFSRVFSIYLHFGLCTAAASVLRSSVLKKSSERRCGFIAAAASAFNALSIVRIFSSGCEKRALKAENLASAHCTLLHT